MDRECLRFCGRSPPSHRQRGSGTGPGLWEESQSQTAESSAEEVSLRFVRALGELARVPAHRGLECHTDKVGRIWWLPLCLGSPDGGHGGVRVRERFRRPLSTVKEGWDEMGGMVVVVLGWS